MSLLWKTIHVFNEEDTLRLFTVWDTYSKDKTKANAFALWKLTEELYGVSIKKANHQLHRVDATTLHLRKRRF